MTERKEYTYYIKLPRNEALEVRDQLSDEIKAIARQKGEEETLREAGFEVRVGKPALDPGTLITVIITYIGMKAVDKAIDHSLDHAWLVWQEKILPALKEKFGPDVLIEQDEEDDD